MTGLDLQTVMNVTNVDLVDSALHAPAAGFGDEDFYPDFVETVRSRSLLRWAVFDQKHRGVVAQAVIGEIEDQVGEVPDGLIDGQPFQ